MPGPRAAVVEWAHLFTPLQCPTAMTQLCRLASSCTCHVPAKASGSMRIHVSACCVPTGGTACLSMHQLRPYDVMGMPGYISANLELPCGSRATHAHVNAISQRCPKARFTHLFESLQYPILPSDGTMTSTCAYPYCVPTPLHGNTSLTLYLLSPSSTTQQHGHVSSHE